MVKYFDVNGAIGAYGAGQRGKKVVDDRRLLKNYGEQLEGGNYSGAARSLAEYGDVAGAMRTRQIPTTDRAGELGNELLRTRIDDVGVDNRRVDRQNAFNRMKAERAAQKGATFSKSPIYGTDENGRTILLQVSDDGSATQTRMPEGVNISTGVNKVDLGTEFALIDKRTGQIIGRMPKDIAGAEAQKEIGKASGKDQAGAEAARLQAQEMLKTVQGIRNDPNRETGTGKSSMFNAVPGTAGFDFEQKVLQLKGQSFLQVYQKLKGGGAISDTESLKGEQAIARLNTAQSEEAFLEALNDLESVIQAGTERMQDVAAEPAPNRMRFNPATGDFE